eukprot:1160529-Pelagomonas_calceolata.AAC.9
MSCTQGSAWITLLEAVHVTAQEMAQRVVHVSGPLPSTHALAAFACSCCCVRPVNQCLLLRMPSNKGFGAAVNYGVLKSVGAFVVILNTDAFVIHGWLSAMLRTFELRPDAGLVGPLFIGSNNQITEAGGIVYSDNQITEAGGIVNKCARACEYGVGDVAHTRVYSRAGGPAVHRQQQPDH